jgi:nucleotidyltransferase/DNA polymerase involved in DNA repair
MDDTMYSTRGSPHDSSIIFLVDMQSFYASVEKAAQPALHNKPIVVSGDPERRSGIILAACPLAKRWGVETAEALWEAQLKCPQLVVVKPHMQRYIDVSLQITSLLEEFSDLTEPYSIDEQFVDMTPTLHLFGTPEQAARRIQQRIQYETGVYARIGIGPNKVLSKMACDIYAKKNPEGIFYLSLAEIERYLWPVPVGKMFGVGRQMRRHFEKMGIRTIGHLAKYPLNQLIKRWGINGHLLWLTARGIDYSPVTPTVGEQQKGIGHQMTLPRDYGTWADIRVILLELSEEVGRRARAKNYVGQTIAVGAQGADFSNPTGFHRQAKLGEPTHFGIDLFKAAEKLFLAHWDGLPIRRAGVALQGLQPLTHAQLGLFDNYVKKEQLSKVMDDIKRRYGTTALVRAVSLTAAGQARSRAEKIGGHFK